MSKHRKHNATVAKIMAMYGKRVSSADYSELMTKTSVSEIAEYLKRNTHYHDTLSSVDTLTIHRGMLENLIKRFNFELYLKIIRFENIGKEPFYNYKIVFLEIESILNCLRHIIAKSENQIIDVPIYANKYFAFDLIEIAKVRSFSELLALLEKTPYYAVLKTEFNAESNKFDYNICEQKLRIYYFNMLRKTISAFGEKLTSELDYMLLTDIDLINVINSFRLTAFFGADTDTIEKNMLPFYGRLSAAKQKEIFGAKTEEEFLEKFSKTSYGSQIIDNGYEVGNLERNASFLRFKYAKNALKTAYAAPISVYSFMYLMEIERNNIISIIEGVRYGLAPNEISSLIIAI